MVWHGVLRLLVAFSGSDESVTIERTEETFLLSIDGMTHELSRETLGRLEDEITDALTARKEFFRTAGEFRADGRYVVERRGAEATGNSTVFESFDELKRLFERLPDRFDADAITRAGITGSRRHMIVRHLVEHPAFPCDLQSRNPLVAEKTSEQVTRSASAMAD